MPPTNRELKFAATKLAILRSLIIRIENQSLDEISIKDICRDSNIATATFFLYFPHKTAILDYFIQLWSVEIAWWIKMNAGSLPPRDVIEGIFDYAGLRAEGHPHLFTETVSWMARKREEKAAPPLSQAELTMAFPDSPGIESIASQSLSAIFAGQLHALSESWGTAANIDLNSAAFTLLSILLATPPLTRAMGSGHVRAWYRAQLDLFWSGLRAHG